MKINLVHLLKTHNIVFQHKILILTILSALYLVEFKKENEKELHDVLSSDRQMMSEVNYMLKRYQASKDKDKNRPSLDVQEEDNQENDREKVSSSQNPSKKRVKREAMLETTNLNNSMDDLHVW